MRFLGWSAFVIVALAVTLIFLLNPRQSIPQGAVSQKMYQPGPYGLQVELFDVEDTQRKTPVNGKYPGSASRQLSGKLWRPYAKPGQGLQDGGYPLVIYSHGFMSFHQEGAYLAEFLATHGYVVVATDFPLTNYFAPGGANLADVANQPGDVRFIIDRVLERNHKSGDSLYQQVDENRIGVMGLSLGGMTTELVTFDPRMKDDRIKAAVSIAGPARMFTKTFFSFVKVPFMMIAGDSDAIVPYEYNALPIREKDPDSVLVTIKGASHAGFAGISAILFRWVNNPDSYGCASMKGKVERNDSSFAALVDEKSGVVVSERTGYCEDYKHLPRSMRPAQQQMFAILAAYSFFESLFNPDTTQRLTYATYLQQTLPKENREVSVDAGNYRAIIKP
jgi:predicted dienelactone hydrolase